MTDYLSETKRLCEAATKARSEYLDDPSTLRLAYLDQAECERNAHARTFVPWAISALEAAVEMREAFTVYATARDADERAATWTKFYAAARAFDAAMEAPHE